jgi:hypothetical protein
LPSSCSLLVDSGERGSPEEGPPPHSPSEDPQGDLLRLEEHLAPLGTRARCCKLGQDVNKVLVRLSICPKHNQDGALHGPHIYMAYLFFFFKKDVVTFQKSIVFDAVYTALTNLHPLIREQSEIWLVGWGETLVAKGQRLQE